jgi:hypothetical protein
MGMAGRLGTKVLGINTQWRPIGRARLRPGLLACFVRIVPAALAARTMIMWIPQLIRCGIHMKSEIPVDRAAAGARSPRGSPRMALTLTMHHFSNGMGSPGTRNLGARWRAGIISMPVRPVGGVVPRRGIR